MRFILSLHNKSTMENYNLQADVFAWLEAAGFDRDDASMQETAISLFFEELKEYNIGVFKNDKAEQIDGLVDCGWVLQNCYYFAVNEDLINTYVEMLTTTGESDNLQWEDRDEIKRYYRAVSISNWSKFCKDEAEARLTVFAYENGTHPDKLGKTIRASHKQVNDKWVVFNSTTRKVLKSINYQPVQEVLKTL